MCELKENPVRNRPQHLDYGLHYPNCGMSAIDPHQKLCNLCNVLLHGKNKHMGLKPTTCLTEE
jgi:hypothetical protein